MKVFSVEFFLWGLTGPAGLPTAYPRDGMSTHSKLLQVCRPDEFFGPPNRCNVQTGDVHFWLSRCGIVIDPSPCTIDLPRGDNVYIPWRRVPPSQLPSHNKEPPREYRCLQNAAWSLDHAFCHKSGPARAAHHRHPSILRFRSIFPFFRIDSWLHASCR